MENMYYKIWVDAIKRIQKNHPRKKDWKISIFIFLTWMNATNIWIIFVWLKFFGIVNLELPIFKIFPGKVLNSFLGFVIFFALPIGIVNYLLIFHNNRYKKLLNNYNEPKYSIAFYYTAIIAVIALISVFIIGLNI